MGEAESGGLKTLLKQKINFIKILQLAFRNSTFERTFEIKHETSFIELYVKRRGIYFLFKTLSSNLQKGEKKKMEKSKKEEAKEGWNKGERRGKMEEEKQEIESKRREE